jgi:hypothetical protein
MLQQAVTFDATIAQVIDLWTSVTRPVAEVLLTPIDDFFDISLPTLLVDYVVVSLIFAAGIHRASERWSVLGTVLRFALSFVFWPLILFWMLYSLFTRMKELEKLRSSGLPGFKEMIESQEEDYQDQASGLRKVFSAFMWAAIILVLNQLMLGRV